MKNGIEVLTEEIHAKKVIIDFRQLGFSLLETLLSMIIGSIILSSIMQLYPLLNKHALSTIRQIRLEQLIWQIGHLIQKDLQRVNFCAAEHCMKNPLIIGEYVTQSSQSCVIFSYDLNRNGRIESAESFQAEWFGYRLRNFNLETQRGVISCRSSGWERLFDQSEVIITDLQIKLGADRRLVKLVLAGHWKNQPSINTTLNLLVRLYNHL